MIEYNYWYISHGAVTRYPVVEAQRVTDILAERYAVAVCRRAGEVVTELQQSLPLDTTLLKSVTTASSLCIQNCPNIYLGVHFLYAKSQTGCVIHTIIIVVKLEGPWFPVPIGVLFLFLLVPLPRQHIRDKQAHLAQLQSQTSELAEVQLPGLIQDMAALQVSTVLHGDYSLKLARQDYFTSKQDKVKLKPSTIRKCVYVYVYTNMTSVLS